jgi:SAM-dependent methyltransferase
MTTTTEPLATTVDYFESVYAEAAGDASRVPWASPYPSKALVNWLNAVGPTLVRCGGRVAIAGCGLGADAREVIGRGYEVTAFDCSGTAVAWARGLDPDHADRYVQADLFEPPQRWVHRFDLVIDINNIQTLDPRLRRDAVSALSRLAAPHGHLLVICRGAARPAADDLGPPWPLTADELIHAASDAGLSARGPVCCFTDDQDVPRIRAVFGRGS